MLNQGEGPFVANPSHSALCTKEALRAQDSNTDLIEVPKVLDCVPPIPKMSIESNAYRGSLIKPFQEIRGRYKKWMNVSRNPFRVAVLSWAQYREENQRYTVLSTCVAPTSKIKVRSAIHSEPFLKPFRQIRNYRKWRKLCKKTFRGEVFLWAQDNGNYHRYTAYYDTGSSGNFIRRAVVEELGLETTRGGSTGFSGLDGNKVTVQDSVMPKWEMIRSGRIFEDIAFHVVEEIPQGLDMILGEGFLIERKVVKMALPNFFDRTSKSSLYQPLHHHCQPLTSYRVQHQRSRPVSRTDLRWKCLSDTTTRESQQGRNSVNSETIYDGYHSSGYK